MNLIGDKYGRLTVIARAEDYVSPKGVKEAKWTCLCECGNVIKARQSDLRYGRTKSCGCYHRKRAAEAKTTHGLRYTRIYREWAGIRNRCKNKNDKRYKDYGGRGICVCEEWDQNFLSFYEWAMSNGYSDELSIDRIDVNGNYCPENCRWTDDFIQANNRRNNRFLTYNGKTQTMAEWSREIGISIQTLASRLNYSHWTVEKALSTPLNHRNSHKE